MNQQKRMVYIYDENLDFYEGLENKSKFVNDALQDARINTRIRAVRKGARTTTDDPYAGVDYNPDPRIEETKQRIAELDAAKRRARER